MKLQKKKDSGEERNKTHFEIVSGRKWSHLHFDFIFFSTPSQRVRV